MFVRKQKIRKKCGIRTYYSIAESVKPKESKHPTLKNLMYLGTAEKIFKVFNWYKKKS